MSLLEKYFPHLTEIQKSRFEQLIPLYKEWNEKINVVSRKDIDQLMLHHILHSLAIAKRVQFNEGAKVLDIGTGGGFPGIPLAIMFENTNFHLVDSIGKKLKVVEDIAEQLQLKNIRVTHIRAEQLKEKYDFVVSRAVAETATLMQWSKHLLNPKSNHAIKNGWLLLKGGDLTEELSKLERRYHQEVMDIYNWFHETYYQTKVLVYIS